jgi:hypothetical protein
VAYAPHLGRAWRTVPVGPSKPAPDDAESSASASDDSADAEPSETTSPKGDRTPAYPDSSAMGARDAVGEFHDEESAPDAQRPDVAGQDGTLHSQTEAPKQAETPIAREMVEQDLHAPDAGEISPGKKSLGKGMYSVASYAEPIGESWRRSVEAIVEVARLCVEASERLTPQERGELIERLPFSETVFSKLTKIGKNGRFQTPKFQRLLPPHYTIMYSRGSTRTISIRRLRRGSFVPT